ncbi:hypothetical protein F383_25225 [Gossypium arboreum]|uniref:Uncharacterized protein n=1 Tax=Gossypium arboreum TaxID=29729 RepID=A0A0B0NZL2_GOSAR|nr:hypothetical protein F383_25225 [Gossypium arboreum]
MFYFCFGLLNVGVKGLWTFKLFWFYYFCFIFLVLVLV